MPQPYSPAAAASIPLPFGSVALVEETFLLVKPDAAANHSEVLALLQQAGLQLTLRSLRGLTRPQAEAVVGHYRHIQQLLYHEHLARLERDGEMIGGSAEARLLAAAAGGGAGESSGNGATAARGRHRSTADQRQLLLPDRIMRLVKSREAPSPLSSDHDGPKTTTSGDDFVSVPSMPFTPQPPTQHDNSHAQSHTRTTAHAAAMISGARNAGNSPRGAAMAITNSSSSATTHNTKKSSATTTVNFESMAIADDRGAVPFPLASDGAEQQQQHAFLNNLAGLGATFGGHSLAAIANQSTANTTIGRSGVGSHNNNKIPAAQAQQQRAANQNTLSSSAPSKMAPLATSVTANTAVRLPSAQSASHQQASGAAATSFMAAWLRSPCRRPSLPPTSGTTTIALSSFHAVLPAFGTIGGAAGVSLDPTATHALMNASYSLQYAQQQEHRGGGFGGVPTGAVLTTAPPATSTALFRHQPHLYHPPPTAPHMHRLLAMRQPPSAQSNNTSVLMRGSSSSGPAGIGSGGDVAIAAAADVHPAGFTPSHDHCQYNNSLTPLQQRAIAGRWSAGEWAFEANVEYLLSGGTCLAVVVAGPRAVGRVADIVGSRFLTRREAEAGDPHCLRARFGGPGGAVVAASSSSAKENNTATGAMTATNRKATASKTAGNAASTTTPDNMCNGFFCPETFEDAAALIYEFFGYATTQRTEIVGGSGNGVDGGGVRGFNTGTNAISDKSPRKSGRHSTALALGQAGIPPPPAAAPSSSDPATVMIDRLIKPIYDAADSEEMAGVGRGGSAGRTTVAVVDRLLLEFDRAARQIDAAAKGITATKSVPKPPAQPDSAASPRRRQQHSAKELSAVNQNGTHSSPSSLLHPRRHTNDQPQQHPLSSSSSLTAASNGSRSDSPTCSSSSDSSSSSDTEEGSTASVAEDRQEHQQHQRFSSRRSTNANANNPSMMGKVWQRLDRNHTAGGGGSRAGGAVAHMRSNSSHVPAGDYYNDHNGSSTTTVPSKGGARSLSLSASSGAHHHHHQHHHNHPPPTVSARASVAFAHHHQHQHHHPRGSLYGSSSTDGPTAATTTATAAAATAALKQQQHIINDIVALLTVERQSLADRSRKARIDELELVLRERQLREQSERQHELLKNAAAAMAQQQRVLTSQKERLLRQGQQASRRAEVPSNLWS